MWHLQNFYGDVVLSVSGGPYLYVESVPLGPELDTITNIVHEDYEQDHVVAPSTSDIVITTLGKVLIHSFVSRSDPSMLGCLLQPQETSRRAHHFSLQMMKQMNICKPDLFTRYTISVDGTAVEGKFGVLLRGLSPGQVVTVSDSLTMETVEIQVRLPPPQRAVLSFEYGENFAGCDAVYSPARIGSGFISPFLRLEVRHS